MTKTTLLAACVAATLFTLPSIATAQSSIGVKGASFSFAGVQFDGSDASFEGEALLDVAITQYHGFQGELSFADTDAGLIGRVGGHLYLEPGAGRKYGFFATYADLDNASVSYLQAGIEGMWSLGERAAFEARAGAGMGTGDLDYIFAGAGVHYALSDTVALSAGVDVAEFDEAGFSAIGFNTHVGIEYDMPSSPIVIFGEVRQDALTGSDGGPSQTSAVLGLRIRLGNSGGISRSTLRPSIIQVG